LLNEGVLLDTEQEQLLSQSEFVAVFAVAQMHFCKIIVGGSHLATLKACTSSNRHGKLVIHIHYPIEDRFILVGELFTTTCDMHWWWRASLFSLIFGSGIEALPNWDVALALPPEGNLAPMV